MKFFIDSNIFIESFKENGLQEADKILKEIIQNLDNHLAFFINAVVFSEVSYHLIIKGKAKEQHKKYVETLLLTLEWKSITRNIGELALKLMHKYKLRPNDALILATCKHYKIPYLISLDTDFENACAEEGITLINSFEEFSKILNLCS